MGSGQSSDESSPKECLENASMDMAEWKRRVVSSHHGDVYLSQLANKKSRGTLLEGRNRRKNGGKGGTSDAWNLKASPAFNRSAVDSTSSVQSTESIPKAPQKKANVLDTSPKPEVSATEQKIQHDVRQSGFSSKQLLLTKPYLSHKEMIADALSTLSVDDGTSLSNGHKQGQPSQDNNITKHTTKVAKKQSLGLNELTSSTCSKSVTRASVPQLSQNAVSMSKTGEQNQTAKGNTAALRDESQTGKHLDQLSLATSPIAAQQQVGTQRQPSQPSNDHRSSISTTLTRQQNKPSKVLKGNPDKISTKQQTPVAQQGKAAPTKELTLTTASGTNAPKQASSNASGKMETTKQALSKMADTTQKNSALEVDVSVSPKQQKHATLRQGSTVATQPFCSVSGQIEATKRIPSKVQVPVATTTMASTLQIGKDIAINQEQTSTSEHESAVLSKKCNTASEYQLPIVVKEQSSTVKTKTKNATTKPKPNDTISGQKGADVTTQATNVDTAVGKTTKTISQPGQIPTSFVTKERPKQFAIGVTQDKPSANNTGNQSSMTCKAADSTATQKLTNASKGKVPNTNAQKLSTSKQPNLECVTKTKKITGVKETNTCSKMTNKQRKRAAKNKAQAEKKKIAETQAQAKKVSVDTPSQHQQKLNETNKLTDVKLLPTKPTTKDHPLHLDIDEPNAKTPLKSPPVANKPSNSQTNLTLDVKQSDVSKNNTLMLLKQKARFKRKTVTPGKNVISALTYNQMLADRLTGSCESDTSMAKPVASNSQPTVLDTGISSGKVTEIIKKIEDAKDSNTLAKQQNLSSKESKAHIGKASQGKLKKEATNSKRTKPLPNSESKKEMHMCKKETKRHLPVETIKTTLTPVEKTSKILFETCHSAGDGSSSHNNMEMKKGPKNNDHNVLKSTKSPTSSQQQLRVQRSNPGAPQTFLVGSVGQNKGAADLLSGSSDQIRNTQQSDSEIIKSSDSLPQNTSCTLTPVSHATSSTFKINNANFTTGTARAAGSPNKTNMTKVRPKRGKPIHVTNMAKFANPTSAETIKQNEIETSRVEVKQQGKLSTMDKSSAPTARQHGQNVVTSAISGRPSARVQKGPLPKRKLKAKRRVPLLTNTKSALTNLDDIRFCRACADTKQPDGKALLNCAKCKDVYYCSRQCQGNDWNDHKIFCKGIKNKPCNRCHTFQKKIVNAK